MSLIENFGKVKGAIRKLVCAAVLLGLFASVGVESSFAINCQGSSCPDQCSDYNETQGNVGYYCDCWACLHCSSAKAKFDQAADALMLCLGLV